MASYNIHIINKFSRTRKDQDYAFFSEAPRLYNNPGFSPIYSNVFQATTLSKDETWTIGMTKNFYAWCGFSDRDLCLSTKVEVNNGKLITLGTSSAPGSTFSVTNKGGRPALQLQAAMSARDGSFAIQTGDDVNENTLMGLAAIDDEGQLKAVASMKAPKNGLVNIAPNGKFFIAAQTASVGAVLDNAIVSKTAAMVDFASSPDSYGAIITHEWHGYFSVKYATQAEFNRAVALAGEDEPLISADPQDAELATLRKQVQLLQQELEATRHQVSSASSRSAVSTATASAPKKHDGIPANVVLLNVADPYPVKSASTWYKAGLPFRHSPGQSRRRDIRDALIQHMQALDYVYEGGSIDSDLGLMFSHGPGVYGNWHSISNASRDWREAAKSLPKHLLDFVGESDDFKVTHAPHNKGLWRARGETESRVTEAAKKIARGEHGVGLDKLGNANGIASPRRSPTPKGDSRSTTPIPAPAASITSRSTASSTNGVTSRSSTPTSTTSRSSTPTSTTSRSSTPTQTHARNSSKPLTNGVNNVQSVSNGLHHSRTCSNHSTTTTKSSKRLSGNLSNGVSKAPNGVKTHINGVHVNVANGHARKYSYPRVQETAIEVAKRRARAVLESEGLTEFASGWRVSS